MVGEAHTGAEARELVASTEPDLLLLDMYLPDFSGLELVRQLAASGERVPDFLLVTAARDIDSVRAAMQLGAFYYLVKPFSFAALNEQLESYRAWVQRLDREPQADQQVIDTLYSLRGTPSRRAAATQHAPADDGPGPRDRLLGAVAGRRRRGGRDPRREPPDRPEVPRCASSRSSSSTST